MEKKPKILIVCNYYLPGYKSGGGMRTIVNMVDRFHDQYDFFVITRDHDGRNNPEPYDNVKINDWNEIRNARVYYLSKENMRISKLRTLVQEVKPDVYYTNSFFATPAIFLVKLRKLRLIPQKNIVIAPCGELSDASLRFRAKKKKVFLNLAKLSGLYKNIIWKASSQLESDEIAEIKGSGGKIFIAPDLPPISLCDQYAPEKKPVKKSGAAKMIYLSRVCDKKNLDWLIDELRSIKGALQLDIVGPIDTPEYWKICEAAIKKLPPNINVEYRGSVAYELVGDLLLGYHFFVLPTFSENFGHVFLEAMAAGCPLVISDRTPWLNLEKKGVGWDIPLEDPDKWKSVIQECVDMEQDQFSVLSKQAREFVVEWLADDSVEKDTKQVLDAALPVTSTTAA